MRDPKLISALDAVEPLPASEYYRPKPGPWPKRTQPSVESENKLHSNLRLLLGEKDVLYYQVNVLKAELKTERKWRRWLTAALAATWSAMGITLKILVPYALKGMLSH